MKLRKYIDNFRKSSSEHLGQFQPNLAQSILGWREFKIVLMKGSALFPRGENNEIAKINWQIKQKYSSQEPMSQYQPQT